jgi:ferredoxin
MKEERFELLIDPTACDGHGVCVELLPECVTFDPWGYPIIEPKEIPTQLIDHAQRAAANCPRLALTLVKKDV